MYKKLEKLFIECKFLKGLYFAELGFVEENTTIFAIFHIRGVFFPTSYFSTEKDPGVVKIVSHILKSLFYQKLVKIVSLDKRQTLSHIGYAFSSYLLITES